MIQYNPNNVSENEVEQSENIAENNEDENLDYTTLFDQLSHYYEHPYSSFLLN